MTDTPPRLQPPSPHAVIEARAHAEHTQEQAAAIVHSTARRWREWEAGQHRMHPSMWELYLLRTQAIILKDPPQLTQGDPPAPPTGEKPCESVTFIL